jgi:hypothetical protein
MLKSFVLILWVAFNDCAMGKSMSILHVMPDKVHAKWVFESKWLPKPLGKPCVKREKAVLQQPFHGW